MTVQSVKLDLPESVFQHLQQAADGMQRPLEEVIEQTIRGNLPPNIRDLPPTLQMEFAALQRAHDRTLWHIAQETVPAEQWARHEELLAQNQDEGLSEAEQQELARLREKVDLFVLRRSYALALLKWRGRSLPISPVRTS